MSRITPYLHEMEFEFTAKMPDDLAMAWPKAVELPERDLIITLPDGQRWAKGFHRGLPVSVDVMGETFRGRVKRRRVNRMVIVGRFDRP